MTCKDLVTGDCWILGQLTGIRMMERELTGALQQPDTPREYLRRQITQLNSWLDLVEDALTGPQSSDREPIVGNLRTLPLPETAAPLPAA